MTHSLLRQWRGRPVRHAAALVVIVLGASCSDDDNTTGTQFTLTIAGSGSGSGTVSSQGVTPAINCTVTAGVVTGVCSQTYSTGTSVVLVAAPTGGGTFAGWSGACSGTSGCTVTVSQTQSIMAAFAPAPVVTFALSVTGAGNGSGSVTSAPAGISCTSAAGAASGQCSASYTQGATVVLTAAPAAGSTFGGWGGACSGTGSCSVAMAAARTVTATFNPVTFALTVSLSGSGNGTVSSAPAGVNCAWSSSAQSGQCSGNYPQGVSVALTATPNAGSTFSGWGGACSGSGGCTVAMSEGRNVTASFAPMVVTFPLAVTISGGGAGTITSNPAGINCAYAAAPPTGSCSANYNLNTQVTLTASPASGSSFGGWGGPCSGLVTGCVVGMSEARNVSATFVPLPTLHRLTVSGAGSGSGTVSSQGLSPALSCTIANGTASGACSQQYAAGTAVTLQAQPAGGNSFVRWSTGSTNATYTSTLNAATTVSAEFAASTYSVTLTVTASGTGKFGTGSMSGQGGSPQNTVSLSVSSGETKSFTIAYPANSTITLTGAAAQTWFAANLTGCTSAISETGGVRQCTVLVNGPKALSVAF